MNKTVFDLVDHIEKIEAVKVSSLLTDAEKQVIYGEMSKSLPPPQFCKSCELTLTLISTKLGELLDGRTKGTQKKGREGTKISKSGPSEGKEELLRKTDGNRRGTRTSKRVVN